MRIVAIAAQTVRWPIAGRGAARGRSERAAVIVEVRGARGEVGLGEAAPLPGMSRETLEDAERAIAGFARQAPFDVVDRDAAFAIAGAAVSAASVRVAIAGAAVTAPTARVAIAGAAVTAPSTRVAIAGAAGSAPSARFAIETALLDALARARGVSLACLLRGPAMEPRVGATVPLAAVVDDPEAARAAVAAGIRWLKIKLTASDDVGRVFAIAAAAPAARLRIDANRTWPRAEVVARLAALAGLPIDYVEEPCRAAHQLLDAALPCKLALDESLGELAPDELAAALRGPALAALVVKPTLLGGFAVSLALAERARQAGVAAIASHGLEGPVGTAACAELALALGGGHPAGLASHAALTAWRSSPPQLAADHLHAAPGHGLGFEDLDLETLVGSLHAGP